MGAGGSGGLGAEEDRYRLLTQPARVPSHTYAQPGAIRRTLTLLPGGMVVRMEWDVPGPLRMFTAVVVYRAQLDVHCVAP